MGAERSELPEVWGRGSAGGKENPTKSQTFGWRESVADD